MKYEKIIFISIIQINFSFQYFFNENYTQLKYEWTTWGLSQEFGNGSKRFEADWTFKGRVWHRCVSPAEWVRLGAHRRLLNHCAHRFRGRQHIFWRRCGERYHLPAFRERGRHGDGSIMAWVDITYDNMTDFTLV